MAKATISTGSSANDGTGDTLRNAATKINANFTELYNQLGADGSNLSQKIKLTDSGGTGVVMFQGATSGDDTQTKLIATDPSQDNIINLPDATDTLVGRATTDTLTNKTLTTPTIASITNGGTVTIPSGADTLVARTSTDTLTNKTLTSPIINSPRIGTVINDANGAELIKLTATGSAVNELTIANGASTTGPTLSATGDASNLNIIMTPKGTGSVELNKAAFSSVTVDTNAASIVSGTLVIGNKNSGGTLTLSLANGTTVGEYKIFTNKGSESMEVTPVTFRGSETKFTLAQFDGCTCIWDGNSWFLVGNQGEVTVA